MRDCVGALLHGPLLIGGRVRLGRLGRGGEGECDVERAPFAVDLWAEVGRWGRKGELLQAPLLIGGWGVVI